MSGIDQRAAAIEAVVVEEAHIGVKAVEAAEKVYGRYSKWFLFIGCVLLGEVLASDVLLRIEI